MTSIWNIGPSVSSIRLFKYDDLNYWIIERGAMTPLIVNGLFQIINEEMLLFFERHVPSNIKTNPIIIYDRVANTRTTGYYRLDINDSISPTSIHELDTSGMKIWSFKESLSGGIFISDALLAELKKSGISGLTYHPGFSCYG